MLRPLIGAYLAIPPNEVRFFYSPRGKPFREDHHGLRFNISHSGEVGVFAFTTGCELGIDVESIRKIPNLEGITRAFFSRQEIKDLASVEASLRTESYLACWTRKEAYVKATGEGITVPLDRFSVSITPGSPPRLLHVEGAPQEAARWSFHAVPLEPGYLAVAAVERTIRTVQHYLCPDR